MADTVVELGQKLKAKYPGDYDHLSDAEVGRKLKAKYPGSYDQFEEVAPGMEQLGKLPGPAQTAPGLPNPNARLPHALQPPDPAWNQNTMLGTAARLAVSPVTGLLSIPGQLKEYFAGKRPPSGGFLSEEPVTQAISNLMMTGAIPAREFAADSAARVGGALWEGGKAAFDASPMVSKPVKAGLKTAYKAWKGQLPTPPPDPTAQFDVTTPLRDRAVPGNEPLVERPPVDLPPEVRGQVPGTSAPSPPTKRVGGFGRSSIPKQQPKVTTTIDPEIRWVDPPEPMGPPPAPPPEPTKRVGGFGRSAIPSRPIRTTTTEFNNRPPIDLPEPVGAGMPPPPEDSVTTAPREAAGPQPETGPPPAIGTPEYTKWFQGTFPDMPLPKAHIDAALKAVRGTPPTAPNLKNPPRESTADTIERLRLTTGNGSGSGTGTGPGTGTGSGSGTGTGPTAPEGSVVVPKVEGMPQRYHDMIAEHGTTGAQNAMAKDMTIAKHLKAQGVGPEDWLKMDVDAQNGYVKGAGKAASKKFKDLGKGGSKARTVQDGIRHIYESLKELQ